MKKDKLEIVKETSEKLLELLEIEAVVKVQEDLENKAVGVEINPSEPGVLIGYHGETLSALQLILGIMVNKQSLLLRNKKIGEWTRIIVNVEDYRQKREETLKRMALAAAQKAHFSGQPVVLGDLSSFERRVVHLALADHSEVETFSEGEGRERRLVIKPKNK